MKREIKFRAWDNINNEMRYPAKKDVFATGPTSGDFIDKWDNVMQFTCLHDKDGKEIYEGDVLHLNYEGVRVNGIVKQQESGTWVLENKEQGTVLGIHHNRDRVEVIGNIYEHHHLIS